MNQNKNSTVARISATADEIENGTIGACRACGKKQYGVEPDAEDYACEFCSALAVCGLEQLLLRSELEVLL